MAIHRLRAASARLIKARSATVANRQVEEEMHYLLEALLLAVVGLKHAGEQDQFGWPRQARAG